MRGCGGPSNRAVAVLSPTQKPLASRGPGAPQVCLVPRGNGSCDSPSLTTRRKQPRGAGGPHTGQQGPRPQSPDSPRVSASKPFSLAAAPHRAGVRGGVPAGQKTRCRDPERSSQCGGRGDHRAQRRRWAVRGGEGDAPSSHGNVWASPPGRAWSGPFLLPFSQGVLSVHSRPGAPALGTTTAVDTRTCSLVRVPTGQVRRAAWVGGQRPVAEGCVSQTLAAKGCPTILEIV